jgi:hypothetical protein
MLIMAASLAGRTPDESIMATGTLKLDVELTSPSAIF